MGDEPNSNMSEIGSFGEQAAEDENGLNGNYDDPDGLTSSFYKEGKKLTAVMSVEKGNPFYKMDHENRGIAVILNHESFDPKVKLNPRGGTDKDVASLEKTLKNLSFDVKTYHNPTVEEIKKIVKKVKEEDHSDNDCFLLACLTHGGDEDTLYAKDGPYRQDMLWNSFTANNCLTLAGKPKLFIIQACRGKKGDEGVTLSRRDDSGSYKIPSHADFLIAYATIPGFESCSTDETSQCSRFIQALGEELQEEDEQNRNDLLTMLTFVNGKIADDFESNESNNTFEKQIACISSMLTRYVKFPKKGNKIK